MLITHERPNGDTEQPISKASSGLVLGAMPNLKSLDLKMLEDDAAMADDLDPWRVWRPALFDNT